MVAAGVLMVALPDGVANVLAPVVRVNVSYEALRPSACGAGSLLLPASRDARRLKFVSEIGVHSNSVLMFGIHV